MDDLDIITGDEPEFFAPVASDLIDGLLGQYQMQRRRREPCAATRWEATYKERPNAELCGGPLGPSERAPG